MLSNRWGKSEGDHIILHSLKINYSCSSYLVSTILFMDLFCLFLGIRRMWLARSCNPVLLSPTLPLMQPWVSSGSGSARVLLPAERDAHTARSVHGTFIEHTLLSQPGPFTTRPAVPPPQLLTPGAQQRDYICLFVFMLSRSTGLFLLLSLAFPRKLIRSQIEKFIL